MKSIRFQRRKPALKPPAFAPKDWLTLGISLIALAVSALTAYYNYFRQVDDFRMVLGYELPRVMLGMDRKTILFGGSYVASFINSGNRSIAVTGVKAVVGKGKFPKDPCLIPQSPVPYKLEPFVVKPAEIVVKNLVPEDFSPGHQKVVDMFKLNIDWEEIPEYGVLDVCLLVNVVTPDNYADERSVRIFELVKGKETLSVGTIYAIRAPGTIVKKAWPFDF
jgi:hypothetical protein